MPSVFAAADAAAQAGKEGSHLLRQVSSQVVPTQLAQQQR